MRYRVITQARRLIPRCIILLCQIVCFCSLTSIGIASSTSAVLCIQNYLKEYPVNVSLLQQSMDQQINQLSQLTPGEIQFMIPEPSVSTLSLYPVYSKQLTPGKVKTRCIHVLLNHPIFLIGCDEQSKAWLARYATQLKKLHAQGFVVNVTNETAMDDLYQIAPQLFLYPLPADELANWLPLKHYPVLISNHLIEQ